jgi:hypothetical protein
MRRYLLVVGGIILLTAALLFFALQAHWRGRSSFGSGASSAPSPRAAKQWELPLVPDVALQISDNDGDEISVYQGTPLVFSITLGNPRARSAVLQNRANELYRSSVEAKVSRGKISRQQADHMQATLQRREVPVIQLGQENAAWPQFLHFVLLQSDGKEEALTWPLQLANAPTSNSVSLDEKTTPQVTYFLDPSAAAQVQPGNFLIAAVLEVKNGGTLAPGSWHGRVESEPVKLTVQPRPSRLAPGEEETLNLQFAHYYKAASDLAQMLQYAQKALKAVPDSIPAEVLVAQVKEAQGDFRSAFESYQQAEREFYSQHPKSYEPPAYLIYKSIELRRKLKSSP